MSISRVFTAAVLSTAVLAGSATAQEFEGVTVNVLTVSYTHTFFLPER